MMPDHVATRRFTKVDVAEISIVDENAIETPVAVMKRKETDKMTTTAEKNIKAAAGAPGISATDVTKNADAPIQSDVVAVEQEASAEVIKRLLTTVELLVQKSVGTLTNPLTPAAPVVPVVPAIAADVVKAKLVEAGLNEEQVAKALASLEPAPVATPTPTPAPVEVAKSVVDPEETQMQVLELLAATITKAKKFTPKRIGELNSAADTLNALLADLNGTGDADVEKSAATPTPAPADVTKTKGDVSADLGVLIGEAVAKALAPLTTELETLKRTHTPATGNAGDVTETPQPPSNGKTVDTQKGFWNGVI